MKRTNIFIFLLITLLLFSSSTFMQACKFPQINPTEKISAPRNKLIPIQGTWKVVDYKDANKNAKVNKSLIGKTAEFSQKGAIFLDETCNSPKYKVKVVNAVDYLFYNYKLAPEDLGIKKDKIEIVSVTCNENLFYDFILIDKNRLLIYMDETFFIMDKISDDTKNIAKIKDTVSYEEKNSNESSQLNSGVFIGIRSNSANISDSPSSYRTIWISSKNKKTLDILKSDGIFFPRKTGFWYVNVNRTSKSGITQDNIEAHAIDSSDNKNTKITVPSHKPSAQNLFRNILFICNDYIGTEYSMGSISNNNLNKFQVLPVDNLENKKGIKISDLVGNVGSNILKDSLNSFLSVRSDKKDTFQDQAIDEENFTLTRRNGHWVMTGRLNSSKNEMDYIDFDLNMFPPKKLLTFDDLSLSWSEVKNNIPHALDVFTSPNGDIAIVVSKDALYVYTIENKTLSSKPIEKIPIDSTESIIMAEWATGDYVSKWTDSFRDFIKNEKNKK
ncbi:hypothetical protein [Haloimpatiens lingqiaonensis]|uniref:hypothetical protein n=1 Tax=Haloimpatiens lingqiaonensis TaxID=1380675 RepID=UPI0010FE2519|nr:hypothetical protein [Haloimpatiens lingqiaonensis]